MERRVQSVATAVVLVAHQMHGLFGLSSKPKYLYVHRILHRSSQYTRLTGFTSVCAAPTSEVASWKPEI